MKKTVALLLSLIAATTFAAGKPEAPHGFKWKTYKSVLCEIQVPDGWFESKRTAGITQVVILSPENMTKGKGINTGLTVNTTKCKTQQEWTDAMTLVGKIMSDIREATEAPIESRMEDTEDMLFMVIEGERLIPNAPHPDKKYHTRTIVRAFPKFATVYMYSFGALAGEWDEAWKKGSVMLAPVIVNLRK